MESNMSKIGILKCLARIESHFRAFSNPSLYDSKEKEEWERYIPIQKKCGEIIYGFENGHEIDIVAELQSLLNDIPGMDANYLKLLIAAIEGKLEEYDSEGYWQIIRGELVFLNGKYGNE